MQENRNKLQNSIKEKPRPYTNYTLNSNKSNTWLRTITINAALEIYEPKKALKAQLGSIFISEVKMLSNGLYRKYET